MKALLLLLIVAVSLCYATLWTELESYTFDDYKAEFNKVYVNENEHRFRKVVFDTNLRDIKTHNADTTRTWKKGVNHLTDRTPKEFKRLLGARKGLINPPMVKMAPMDVSHLEGTSKDWRDDNVITAVKDQGDCGSCWTFGSTETLESYWALKTGQLVALSEQQVLDCTPNNDDCGGTGGCNGGTIELAYGQVIKQKGISTEWVYPYTSYHGAEETCQTTKVMPFANLTSFVNLPSNQYAPVLAHIASKGPLGINVAAFTWQFYESGVYDGCSYSNVDIDHVVQLVGFGTDEKGGDFWTVRNSWGPAWGEKGYIRLKRESQPQCGVDTKPSDGTGCKNGPSKVTVCGQCGVLYDTVYPVI